jgi:hypothetical protein
MNDPTPRLSPAEAASLLHEQFGLTGELVSLPSERDQNFRVQAAAARFVLKIAKSDEPREVLEFQNASINHLRGEIDELDWPMLQKAVGGAEIAQTRDRRGQLHFVRVFSWVEGTPLAQAAPHCPRLLGSLGRALARIDRSLQRFSHPAMHRALEWDLKRADAAFRHTNLMSAAQRSLIDPHIAGWHEILWPLLRHGVIHGDANDYNVLVRSGEVTGVLDFGDMVHSALACDLAIGAAYAMLGKRDPLPAACDVISAYSREFPLSFAEGDALFPLIGTRLAMSVCYSTRNARDKIADPYQQVSAAPAWQLLADLAGRPPRLARDACRTAALTG